MDIESVGIVGAGQMGSGIAHVFALAGFDVLMTDISEDSLAKALSQIDRNIERQVSRGKVTPEAKAAAMARIRTTLRLADVGPSDLIIEAATDQALNREHRVFRVGNGLALGGLADQPLAILGEGDDRRRCARAFSVFDNLGLAALHH